MCALLHKVTILSQTNVFPIKESAIWFTGWLMLPAGELEKDEHKSENDAVR